MSELKLLDLFFNPVMKLIKLAIVNLSAFFVKLLLV